ncbi:MAG: rhomboid family intramembrane serine protease [Treponemataceae bacterium]|nr:rhomboid family intramembrane serine protease [Treponemataceae bacterium]
MMLKNLLHKPFKYAYYNAALIIIGINVAVFLLLKIKSNLISYLALNTWNVTRGHMYWQFFTYMFVHDLSSFQHIFFNMLGLLFFGVPLEKAIGSKEFILLYLLSGLFCGVASFLIYLATGMYYVFLYGASGALYAILLAYAVVYPRAKIFVWGILPIPAPILIAIYAGIEIASQIFSLQSGTAHMTHLAGFAFAWLYFIIRMGINPIKVWKNAYR